MPLRTVVALLGAAGVVLLVGLTAGAPDEHHELADATHLGPRLVVISIGATLALGLGLLASASRRPWLRAVTIVGALVLVGVMIGLFEDVPPEPTTAEAPPPVPPGDGPERTLPEPPEGEPSSNGWSTTGASVRDILADLWMLLALGALAAAAVLVAHRLSTRQPNRPVGPVGPTADRQSSATAGLEVAREQMAQALDRAIVDLPAHGDPRAVVLAAYVRMTDSLAEQGIERDASDTPLEYLARALVRLQASATAIRTLTDLLEVAMFSTRPIERGMADAAVAAFTEIRDELRSPAWAGR